MQSPTDSSTFGAVMREQNPLRKHPLCFVEAELSANPIANEQDDSGGDVSHAFTHNGTSPRHVPQGVNAGTLHFATSESWPTVIWSLVSAT
jgi:hypothetical protein